MTEQALLWFFKSISFIFSHRDFCRLFRLLVLVCGCSWQCTLIAAKLAYCSYNLCSRCAKILPSWREHVQVSLETLCFRAAWMTDTRPAYPSLSLFIHFHPISFVSQTHIISFGPVHSNLFIVFFFWSLNLREGKDWSTVVSIYCLSPKS